MANLNLTDNWRGTTTQFLLHFKEQLRLLDNLVSLDEQFPDSTRMAFLQRAVEGVPDLRRVRILDGVMTAKSGSFTTITYEGYFKLLHDASFHHDKALSEGSKRCQIKAHEAFTKPSQETPDYHLPPQDDTQPTVEEDIPTKTYEGHMSNFKPKDNTSTLFIPEILWKKFSSEDRKLIIEYNKRFLPRLGHHLQSYRMLLGFQMVENPETSLATKNKNQKPIHQIILPMKQHLIKINSCLQWFMKPSIPLFITHPLTLTKFCPSTKPTQQHLRHPTSSPRPRPTFHSTN